MILKALYDYYHRSGDDVAPFGLEYKEIGFIIVIDRCGKFLRFEDRRIDKKSAQQFLVKKSVSRYPPGCCAASPPEPSWWCAGAGFWGLRPANCSVADGG